MSGMPIHVEMEITFVPSHIDEVSVDHVTAHVVCSNV